MSVAPATPDPSATPASRHRLAGAFWRRRRLRVATLLAAPIGWLGIVYLGSLAVLLAASFWTLDEFSGQIVKGFSLDNFRTIIEEPVYRRIVGARCRSRRW